MAKTIVPLAKNQAVASRTTELDLTSKGEAIVHRSLRHFWHPVAYSHEIKDVPVRVSLCEQDLVVARLDGEACVFNDLCAHRGAALSLGKVVDEGTALRCPLHGWQYNKEGLCILAPQRPDLSKHIKARIRKFNATEAYGLIWACLEDRPHFPLPEFPEYEAPGFTSAYVPFEDWNCSAPRRTENYCDLSHAPWVHDGTLGSSAHPEVPPYGVWRDERSVYIDVPGVKLADAGYKLGAEIASAYRSVVFMPLTVRADMNFAGHRFIVLFHPSPLGPTRIRNFTVAIINSPADPEMLRAALIGGLRTVYGQDRPIVESQRPQELPEDLSYELHIKGADAFFLVYRRFLFDLARELAVRACA